MMRANIALLCHTIILRFAFGVIGFFVEEGSAVQCPVPSGQGMESDHLSTVAMKGSIVITTAYEH